MVVTVLNYNARVTLQGVICPSYRVKPARAFVDMYSCREVKHFVLASAQFGYQLKFNQVGLLTS